MKFSYIRNVTSHITIKHLLNHTSGLHDYFGDKPKQVTPFLDQILSEPSRFWTPQEIVQWSKEHLKSHFPPGEGFHYSDTGYHILGLVIENITSMPFHKALEHYLFMPLGMNHSYLICYSEPLVKSDYPIVRYATLLQVWVVRRAERTIEVPTMRIEL